MSHDFGIPSLSLITNTHQKVAQHNEEEDGEVGTLEQAGPHAEGEELDHAHLLLSRPRFVGRSLSQ